MKYKYLFLALCIGCFYSADANAFWGMRDKIYSAARRGDAATLSSYVNQGYSVDSTNDGVTALCQAYRDQAWGAYELLMRYGANSGAACMHRGYNSGYGSGYGSSSGSGISRSALIGGVAIVAIGGGIAAAAFSGGGGGHSSSSKGSSGNNGGGSGNNGGGSGDNGGGSGDNGGGSDDNGDDSGDDKKDDGSIFSEEQEDELRKNFTKGLATLGYSEEEDENFHFIKKEEFRNDKEYNGSYFAGYSSSGINFESLNFHDPIQAATAYNKFYGYDADKNLVNRLNKEIIVGVLDTGVDPQHDEFITAGGNSIVFGHNFDYGPCRGSDRTNCWYIESECDGTICYSQKRTFYDSKGMAKLLDQRTKVFVKGNGTLDKWAAMYPDDYDWDDPATQNDPTPLEGYNPLTGWSSHGTHVAGIIGAQWHRNNQGMMGIAFTNTKIDAVRWDLVTPMLAPITAMINDHAYVINMSIGRTADKNNNASLIKTKKDNLYFGYLDAAAYSIRRNTLVKYNTYSAYDGTIWVKAAGNEGFAEPDLESGIKNLGVQKVDGTNVDFSKMLMLVVVSVNVEMNNDGTVRTYTKSSYSNACGSTAAYCIAAPGGDYISGTQEDIYSAAEGSYLGMHGTSQATPVVSGSIAFLKEAFPFLQASEIIDILRQTANTSGTGYDHSKEHYDEVYGAGLIDLGKATTYYISPDQGTGHMSTVAGSDVDSEPVRVDDAALNVTMTMAEALQKALPETLTIFDLYHRPFKLPTLRYVNFTHSGYKMLKNDVNHIVPNQRIQHEQRGDMRFSYAEGPLNKNGFGLIDVEYKSGRSTSGFFLSENTRYQNMAGVNADLVNPFMTFDSAYGMRYGFALNDDWQIRFEAVGGQNGLYDGDTDSHDRNFRKQAYGFNSEVDFRPTTNVTLTFSSGMLYEDEALLGMNGSNAFGMPESQTYHTGMKAAWKASPALTLSGSYYTGFTRAQSFNSNMLSTSDLISDSFAFDANYKYNKTTDFGFRVSSPLRVEHGKLYVDVASGRDNYSNEVYRNRYSASLKPTKREYKLAWYLNKDLSDKIGFSSEFDVRINPDHYDTKNDYRALFGLTWNFD